MSRQKGIALVQVLLVTGIIALLMLQMGLTAREQVARAQMLADRAELQLAAQSREAALVYTLLTEPLASAPESANPYAAAWNFRNEPFVVDGITFRIQDESGRVRVPDRPGIVFENVLVAMGVEPALARRLYLELMAQQGVQAGLRELGAQGEEGAPKVRGLYPLQDLGQLRLLPSMTDELFRRLEPVLTLYPTPGFNPTTAAPALLNSMLTKSQSRGLEEARSDGEIDPLTLWRIAGVDDAETFALQPGPGLTVRLEMELRSARTARTTTLTVRPYQSEPFAIWQRTSGFVPESGGSGS